MIDRTALALVASFALMGVAGAQTSSPPSAPAAEAVPASPPLEGAPMVGVSAPGPAAAPAVPPVIPPGPVHPTTTAPAQGPVPVVSAATPALPQARVLSVTAIPQPVMGSRLVCSDAAEVPAPTTGAGAVAGALVGAAVGSQVGSGAGTALATAAGFVGGALLGDKGEQGGRTQTVRQCVTQSGPSVAYQVVYEFAGQQYSATLPYHPGATLQVQVAPVVPSAPAVTPIVGQPTPIVIAPSAWAVPSAGLVVGVNRGWSRHHHHGGWRGHRHGYWRY